MALRYFPLRTTAPHFPVRIRVWFLSFSLKNKQPCCVVFVFFLFCFFCFTFSGRSGQIDDHVHLPLRLQVDLQRQRRGRETVNQPNSWVQQEGRPSSTNKHTSAHGGRSLSPPPLHSALSASPSSSLLSFLCSTPSLQTPFPPGMNIQQSICDLDKDFFLLSAFSVVSILLLWGDHNV